MDYQLYPVRKRDLDKPLYLLVKAAILTHSYEVMMAYFQEFDEEVTLDLKQLFFNHANQRCYLVFPSCHRQFRLFPPEVTSHHAIIAVFDKMTMNLSGYYTLDKQETVNGQPLGLNWHAWKSADVPAPVFPHNTYELLQAVLQVMQILETHDLASCEWYERLSSVCELLENDGDKMHILHNGGLYDHNSLRQFLKEQGLEQPSVAEALDELVSQLEQYAMYAVSVARLIDRHANYIYRREDEEGNSQVHSETKKTETVQRVVRRPQPPKPIQQVVPPPPTPEPPLPPEPSPIPYLPATPEPPVHEVPFADEPRQEVPQPTPRVTVNKADERARNNWRVIRRVAIYTLSILAVVLIGAWLVYLYKGTAVFIGGGAIGVITYQVMRLSGDYEHLHPDWFRRCLLFFAIFAVWGFVFLGRWLGFMVYDLTGGIIGPGYLLLMVIVLLTVLFFWALRGRRRAGSEKAARPYSFLIVLAIIILIGQLLGSIVAGQQIANREWEQSLQSSVLLNQSSL